MQSLLRAIQSAFAANSTLTAAFPSGLWGEAAPEGRAMPYVVQKVIAAPVTRCYGTVSRAEVQIQFCVYGPGRNATLGLGQTLAAALETMTLSLSSGQAYDSRQLTDVVPVREGRDASVVDDPAQGDVYAAHVTFEFAVRTS